MEAFYIALMTFPMGIVGALLGVGGGTFLGPLLMIGLGLSAQEAAPISLACALSTGIGGALGLSLEAKILKKSIPLQLAALLGVGIFAPMAYAMKTKSIMILFGVFIVAIAYINLHARVEDADHHDEGIRNIRPMLSALLAGACSGLFGIGGGIVLVPALRILSKIPLKEAVQISLLVLVSTSLFGLFVHSAYQSVAWNLVGISALATFPAGIIGRRIRLKVHQKYLHHAFSVFAVCMALIIFSKAALFS